MRWAQKQRMAFIASHVKKHGWIGRAPLMEEFDISAPQASLDLKAFQEMYPGAIVYSKFVKRYIKA